MKEILQNERGNCGMMQKNEREKAELGKKNGMRLGASGSQTARTPAKGAALRPPLPDCIRFLFVSVLFHLQNRSC